MTPTKPSLFCLQQPLDYFQVNIHMTKLFMLTNYFLDKILLEWDNWTEHNAQCLPIRSCFHLRFTASDCFIIFFHIRGEKKVSVHSSRSNETRPVWRNHKLRQPTAHYQSVFQYRYCCRCQTVWADAFTQSYITAVKESKLQRFKSITTIFAKTH